ncbi:MAG: sensor histidine kinase [Ginsengibacter sp.]
MSQLQIEWEKSFTDKRYLIGLHVIFWFIYIFLLLVVSFFLNNTLAPGWRFDLDDMLGTFLSNLLLMSVTYYITIFLSYRSVFIKKKYMQGLFYLIICIVIFIQLFYFINKIAISLAESSGKPLPPYTKSIATYIDKGYVYFMTVPFMIFQIVISYFFYMFLPVSCKFLRDQLRMQKKQSVLQKKNIQLEMDFLKAQIHPHFLFNTLNNIYSLITHDENKKSAEMVSGLSSLLRYALYDGKTEFILLEKEIAMIKDFIGLEEVRTDELHLDVLMPDTIPAVKLPPFLLLPLIENAFKHGANSQLSDPCIKIDVYIVDDQLCLQVENSFDHEYRKENSGGLGLVNLKKRLDYYYHDSYFLETDEKNNIFIATLKLPLSCPQSNA